MRAARATQIPLASRPQGRQTARVDRGVDPSDLDGPGETESSRQRCNDIFDSCK
jgi:hypothetical protein